MRYKIRYIMLSLALTLVKLNMFACPVCESQQPSITKGITHGTSPQSNWDWLIIGIMTSITLITLIFSIKYLIKPGEKSNNHIKQLILSN